LVDKVLPITLLGHHDLPFSSLISWSDILSELDYQVRSVGVRGPVEIRGEEFFEEGVFGEAACGDVGRDGLVGGLVGGCG